MIVNPFGPDAIEQEKSIQQNQEVEIPEPPLLFTRPELLIHPTLPEPLHGINPRTLMGQKKWDEERRNCYAINNYHCFACGVFAPYDTEKKKFIFKDRQLHAHEAYHYDYKKCEVRLNEVVALCPTCHNAIHIQRSQAMFDKGLFDCEDMFIILTNRETVLGFDKWDKWCLIWGDKKVFSQFKNKKEWEEHYAVTR